MRFFYSLPSIFLMLRTVEVVSDGDGSDTCTLLVTGQSSGGEDAKLLVEMKQDSLVSSSWIMMEQLSWKEEKNLHVLEKYFFFAGAFRAITCTLIF